MDQTLRPFDQRREDIRRQDVNGEEMRQAVLRHDAPWFPIADADVMNHGVEPA